VKAEADSVVIAQKILSCVARLRERFGVGHVLDILRGQNNVKVAKYQHDQLSTYGLLRGEPEAQLRDWVDQLIDQKVLWIEQKDHFSMLRLNAASWELMRGQRSVQLVRSVRKERVKRAKVDAASWDGVDTGLFEEMRVLRREIAQERQVPPYVIFSDATLRDLARRRPSKPEQMLHVYGVGEAKMATFGNRFLECIRNYCREKGIQQR
jgi:ATP-dependent DNA helicase RecQ